MTDPQSPQDPLEAFRRLWGPLGVPVPGMAMPTLDPAEIDRRVAELKAVEGWLAMNLNMLRMAIQGLEMQKSGLQAMRAAAEAGQEAASAAQPSLAMLWPWLAMPPAGGIAAGSEPSDSTHDKEKKP